VAYGILGALDLRRFGPDIISCPTCGRCEIDLPALVEEVERRVAGTKEYVKIALMGCVVNGPGEAAEADIGIAGGRRQGLVFRKGVVVRKVKEDRLVDALMEELDAVIREKSSRSNGETNN
jgi:(E)-4-hydroxy-3-methylbut-2-enyl-diphosphate synthase